MAKTRRTADASPSWVQVCRDPRAFEAEVPSTPIVDARDAWKCLRDRVAKEDQEVFYVIVLDVRSRVRTISEVHRGTINRSIVHPREVFRLACAFGAHSIIAAHNHPAGSLTPSPSDIELTKRLVEASRVLDIPLQDHLIVTGNGYYSFAESGKL